MNFVPIKIFRVILSTLSKRFINIYLKLIPPISIVLLQILNATSRNSKLEEFIYPYARQFKCESWFENIYIHLLSIVEEKKSYKAQRTSLKIIPTL